MSFRPANLGIQPEWMTSEKYHGGAGFSTSNIKKLKEKSPGHMIYAKEHPTDPTEAMGVGQAFHTLTLEPQYFHSRFHVIPAGFDRKSNDRKAQYAEWVATGKIMIKEEKLADVREMVKAVHAHPAAAALLIKMGAVYELPVYWEDQETGILCKCRPDIMINNSGQRFLADLKKCQDASPEGFTRACGNYLYDVQAGMYLDGCSVATGQEFASFSFICCEDEAPYGVAVYEASEEMVALGKRIFREAMSTIDECMSTGVWPMYPGKVQTIDLPRWRYFDAKE